MKKGWEIALEIVGSVLDAVSELIKSGATPEEIQARLEELRKNPPKPVDLAAARQRSREILDPDQ